jgi:hypothetical protein
VIQGRWTQEVYDKARMLHAQLAALQAQATDAEHATAIMEMLGQPYFRLLNELFVDELPWAHAMDNSDLVIRLRGPAANEDAPRVKLIADTFDSVREQIHRIARAVAGLSDARIPMTPDLDLGLSGFARGSVVIGLKVRGGEASAQTTLLSDNDPLLVATREAVRHLGEIPRYVHDNGMDAAFAGLFPDPSVRDVVLSAAAKLAPTGQRGIEAVEFTVPADEPSLQVPMTAHTRAVLRQALVRPVKQEQRGEFKGVVRELDLDLRRFELRRMEHLPSLRCAYADLSNDRAKLLLNATIRVTGRVALGPGDIPRLLEVEKLDVIQAPPEQQEIPLK